MWEREYKVTFTIRAEKGGNLPTQAQVFDALFDVIPREWEDETEDGWWLEAIPACTTAATREYKRMFNCVSSVAFVVDTPIDPAETDNDLVFIPAAYQAFMAKVDEIKALHDAGQWHELAANIIDLVDVQETEVEVIR